MTTTLKNSVSAKTQDNEWVYKYDANNNLINANFVYKDKSFNFEYKYNNLNYLERIIYPSKKEINFSPNILGQSSQVGDFVKDIQYTTKGDIISYNYANGVKFNKLINTRYLPENFSYQLNNRNINVNYTYDILNNITKIIHSDNSVLNLGYDNQDRLSSVSGLNINGDIQYDKFDNILKNSITKSFYNYDVNNRLISTASNSTQNFSYDNAGRLINDGVHSYSYSPEDKLISVDDVKYSYDANGNKISNSESLFIHNKLSQKLLEIKDNKYSEYFYLGNLLIAKTEKDIKNNQEKTNYYHNDLLGSIIGSSDENGNVISETLHLPFGLEANNINNDSNKDTNKEIGGIVGKAFKFTTKIGIGAANRRAAYEISTAIKDTKFSPIKQGGLKQDIVQTFSSNTYTQKILFEDTKLYRVTSEFGNPYGSFWTRERPQGAVQAIIDLALNPKWGNSATKVHEAVIPAGTRIFEGTAAPQSGLVGGGNQIYIEVINKNWVK